MIFDLETTFIYLLTIWQQKQMDLADCDIYQHEFCPVPPSPVDEYGCLRNGSKALLAQKLHVETLQPKPPDVTIVDMNLFI